MRTQQQKAHKNMLSGFVEDSHLDHFQFETQRRTFQSYGRPSRSLPVRDTETHLPELR